MTFRQYDFATFQKKIHRPVVDGTLESEVWQLRQQVSKLTHLLLEERGNGEYWQKEVMKQREFLDGLKIRRGNMILTFEADKRGSSIAETQEPPEALENA